MASLYEEGWRQGSILEATLPLDAVVLGPTGHPERRQGEHNRWVVATQDCDLDQTDSTEIEPSVELGRSSSTDRPATGAFVRQSFSSRTLSTSTR